MARPKTNITSKTYTIRLNNEDLVQYENYVEKVKRNEKYLVRKSGKENINNTAIIQDLMLSGLNKNTFGSTEELINAQVEKRVEEETDEAVKMFSSLGLNDSQKNNLEKHLSFNTNIIQDVVKNIHDDQTSFTSTITNLVNKMANQVEKNNSVLNLENEIQDLLKSREKVEKDLERAIDYSDELKKIIQEQNKTIQNLSK